MCFGRGHARYPAIAPVVAGTIIYLVRRRDRKSLHHTYESWCVTVVGLDDTDSRETGMCTTYAAALVAERLRREHTVRRLCLVRLNPSVPYKTRGNAALAVHTDADAERAFGVARDIVDREAQVSDDQTNPGVIVAPDNPDAVPDEVADFSERGVREHCSSDRARSLASAAGYEMAAWGNSRGLVGALAAVGAYRAWSRADADTTYETIAYRARERWGTERDVNRESLFAAADAFYPIVWDTVDRELGEAVCVPHTPGPVLYGIRGDDAGATRACADRVESESLARRETFLANQGTDAHLQEGTVAGVRNGRAYQLDAWVATSPQTHEGGHVFLELTDGDATIHAAAFEPTGRFRDRVRALRVGDRITGCGEVTDGTLKLEKLALRELDRTEVVTPTCQACGRRMESAGRTQGYRCRDCGTSAGGKVQRDVDRDLELGWYEVPPDARRHIAKPLVRGGFDAPTHPER